MSLLHIQAVVTVAWFAVMIAVIGTGVALDVPVTGAGVAGWLLLAFVPPLVAHKTLFRPAAPVPVTGRNSTRVARDVIEL